MQNEQRVAAWMSALKAVCPSHARVLDLSPSPMVALLAAKHVDVHRPVVRVEGLPPSVTDELIECNGLLGVEPPAMLLLPSPRPRSDGSTDARAWPPTIGVWEDASGEPRPANVILADTDAHDVFDGTYLPRLEVARGLAPGKALLMPDRIEIWVALVQSRDLMRLNQVNGSRGGFDLSSLNRYCRRSRAVQLGSLTMEMITQPTLAFTMRVNEVVSRNPTTYSPLAQGCAEVDLEVMAAGEAHALLVWHTIHLTAAADGPRITTGPAGTGSVSADAAARQVAYFLWTATEDEVQWHEEGPLLAGLGAEAQSAAARASGDARAAADHAAIAARAAREACTRAAILRPEVTIS